MQGIELAEAWYKKYLLPALEEELPGILSHCAVGIAGRGSECFGFDDDVSRDHDFNPRASIWLTPEDDQLYGFKLIRLYNRVCKESGKSVETQSSLLGDSEKTVEVIDDFLLRHLGYSHVPETWQQWFYTPEYAFAEVVNGKVFSDIPNVFSKVREDISFGMPEDVRLKKIAAHTIMMAQCGQYNYPRCIKHNEPGAAAIALSEFIRHTAHLVHLLNFKFTPYYKWMIKSMSSLPTLGNLSVDLNRLPDYDNKIELIEKICTQTADELRRAGLSSSNSNYLEPHAFEIISHIRSREIKTLPIMEG